LAATVVVVACVLAALAHAWPPHVMTMETGPVGGSYYLDTLAYQRSLAARGIELRIRQTPNSMEIAGDVRNPRSGVDVGFVAQDVSDPKDASLVSLGQTELQPLFIFTSAELGRRSVLDDLRGRRIVMPSSNSATTAAAILVFDLYDITPENSSFTFMPLADAVHELQAGHFDAGVFMLAPENPVVRGLASDSSLHLVPISEVQAIANHLPFLRPVVLPRGIYSIADAIPPNDTPMVAAPVSVVARESLHPYLLYAMLEAMSEVHRPATFLGGAGEFPTPTGSPLRVHPLAVEYYRSGMPWAYRTLPPWLASAVNDYQFVALGGLLLVIIYLIAGWLADTFAGLSQWFQGWRRPHPEHAAEGQSAAGHPGEAAAAVARDPPTADADDGRGQLAGQTAAAHAAAGSGGQ
jgi:TRAP transporter TAXI family solute receptor